MPVEKETFLSRVPLVILHYIFCNLRSQENSRDVLEQESATFSVKSQIEKILEFVSQMILVATVHLCSKNSHGQNGHT